MAEAARGNCSTELREKVFRRIPGSSVCRSRRGKTPDKGWTARYADSYNVEFTTEESVRVQAQLFVPRNGKTGHPALIYVKGREDIVYPVDYDNILSALSNHVVLVLKPRAVDYPMDNFRHGSHKDERGAAGDNSRIDAVVGPPPIRRLPG